MRMQVLDRVKIVQSIGHFSISIRMYIDIVIVIIIIIARI